MSWSSSYLTKLQKEIEKYKDRMLKVVKSEKQFSRQKNLIRISQQLDNLILSYQSFSRNLNLYQTEPYTVDFYMDTDIDLSFVSSNNIKNKYTFCNSGSSIWLAYSLTNESNYEFIIVQDPDGDLKGVLTREKLQNLCVKRTSKGMISDYLANIGKIFDNVPVSIFILDEEFFIEYANAEAIKNFNDILPESCLFKKADMLFSGLFGKSFNQFIETEFWHNIKNYSTCSGIEVQLLNCVNLVANVKTVRNHFGRKNIIVCLMNVDDLKQEVEKLVLNSDDLIQALRLFLPYQIEAELRTIPEYRDIYNYDTGKITIISKIKDGGYWHVINCLRIIAQLDRTGIFQKYDIDKDILVQAITVHDIGKKQPQLDIGETLDPNAVFEPGKLHAKRSALYCKQNGYRKETILLVKYHHHHEYEIPKNWSRKLLLVFRIFKLIDGLSAAITRRNATVNFELQGDLLVVHETNKQRPEYSQKYNLSLTRRNHR